MVKKFIDSILHPKAQHYPRTYELNWGIDPQLDPPGLVERVRRWTREVVAGICERIK